MFIHINAFNFINIISLSSVGRNKKVKKEKKKKKGDRSLLLGLIVITEQVETLYYILRIEVCSSIRLLSPSRWKPYITSYGEKPDSRFNYYHQSGENLTLYPKDRNLILDSIIIIDQVKILHFVLRMGV